MIWTGSDFAIIVATLAGPILAVQAQKYLEARRANRDRREAIFRILMATRANLLSPAHVEAINAIPVDFYGPRDRHLKAINDKWHEYLNWLNPKGLSNEVWNTTRLSIFTDLLHLISQYLGYTFNRTEIENDIYHPTGLSDAAQDTDTIRKGVARLLTGETAIPMEVREFPAMEDHDDVVRLRTLMLEWFEGQRAVKFEGPEA